MKTIVNKRDLHFAILATDVALFTVSDGTLKLFLIDVSIAPFFVGMRGLPGGLITPSETAEDSVRRHIKNKAGFLVPHIEQLGAFSAIDRDPRGRVVSVAYIGCVPATSIAEKAQKGYWVDARRIPKLAYDHNEIAKHAIARIRAEIWHTDIARYLVEKEFTLGELQSVYESVLGERFDKRNFRKKINALGVVEKTAKMRRDGAHRPAELFRFISP
jgi:8-oxo-dGTP diphosphatase